MNGAPVQNDHLDDHGASRPRRGMPWPSILVSVVGLLACLGAGAAYGMQTDAGAQPQLAGLLVPAPTARSLESSVTAKANSEQARVLATGPVTRSTYLAAASAAATCVKTQLEAQAAAHGVTLSVTVSKPTLSTDGYQADYTYRVAGSPAALASDSVDSRGAVDEACQRQHVEAIEQVYHLQRRSDSTWVQGANNGFDRCVAQHQSEGAAAPSDARAYVLDRMRAYAAAHPTKAGTPLTTGNGLSPSDRACLDQYPSIASEPTAATGN
jgi:hypothetical protein